MNPTLKLIVYNYKLHIELNLKPILICAVYFNKKSAKAQKAVVAVADSDKDELFAFTCTSNYANITKTLQVLKSKLGLCIDSGAE